VPASTKSVPDKRRTRRSFGALRQLPSKRYQASYLGPDDRRHIAPVTFNTKGDAQKWISTEGSPWSLLWPVC
jgi:hypothetical protein